MLAKRGASSHWRKPASIQAHSHKYSRLVTGSRVVTTPGNGISLSKAAGQASDGGDEPHAEGNHRERSPVCVLTMRPDTMSQDSIRRQLQPSAIGRGINESKEEQKRETKVKIGENKISREGRDCNTTSHAPSAHPFTDPCVDAVSIRELISLGTTPSGEKANAKDRVRQAVRWLLLAPPLPGRLGLAAMGCKSSPNKEKLCQYQAIASSARRSR